MAFPVDLLDNCSHEELENAAEEFMTDLRFGDAENPEYFPLPNKSVIPVSLTTVGVVPLYGGDQTHKVLALFSPEDPLTAVALYLADQWWAIDEIVRTTDSSRDGLRQVKSVGERVVLYVLNRIIYRKQEMERDDVPFLCHSSTDYAKVLWKKGEAIGFYSVKPTGSMCSSYLSQNYRLPVLDTMYVRKRHHEKNFELQMLEDFVDSFTEDALGLRYPLSSCMHTACRQYLEKYPGDSSLLWEVEGVGHWFQRTAIISRIQKIILRNTGASESVKSSSGTGDCLLHSSTEEQSALKVTFNQSTVTQLPMENREVMDTYASTSEVSDSTPVSTRTRSSHLKRPAIGRKLPEADQVTTLLEDDSEPKTSSVDLIDRLDTIEDASENSEESIENQTEEEVEESTAGDNEEAVTGHKVQTQESSISPVQKQEECGEEAKLEPLNGEITEGTMAPLVSDEETNTETSKGELKYDSDGEMATKIVLLVAEDIESDKVINSAEIEILTDVDIALGEQATEEKTPSVPEQRTPDSPDAFAAVPNEESSDNGLSNLMEAETEERTVPTNVSPNMTVSAEEGEEVAHEVLQASIALGRGALAVVELEDVSALQHREGQKRPLEDQPEESTLEKEQFMQCSGEKVTESSSEEIEAEVPVLDRRGFRRKAKTDKGTAKKRSKVQA
uniref:Soluble lamin-associated protein of 75 kDa n=1 Tax=Geotrypetes seraphini TaxID=260995 RepID=A0A6P8PMI7_GEOSA|nr:soluble lamin-associated protein of 75 kDa [Geotrypetes seraphini]XP_033785185.1 soluble lamin-associated protein of 75 kDa [Geotrypetes seraphini]XP_033785186.1 soluble lamin-associated protein of 75 kDa [Geotrypetes seraphini]